MFETVFTKHGRMEWILIVSIAVHIEVNDDTFNSAHNLEALCRGI